MVEGGNATKKKKEKERETGEQGMGDSDEEGRL